MYPRRCALIGLVKKKSYERGGMCVCACVKRVCAGPRYIRRNNYLHLIMLVTGLCLLVSHRINHCVSLAPLF